MLNKKVITSSNPVSLSVISDVDISNKVNGYALQYNSVSGKFESQPLPSGSGTVYEDISFGEDVIAYTSPVISSNFTTSTTGALTTDFISIPYTVVNTGVVGLVATYKIDGVSTSSTISSDILSGNNTWNVGTLVSGNYTLTLQVSDSGGLSSNILTFKINSYATTYSGFTTNGLSLFMQNPANNIIIPNSDNYFMNADRFTIAFMVKVPNNGEILGRYVFQGSQNKYRINKSGNQYVATFYATDSASVSLPSVNISSLANYSDATIFSHIVIVRDNPYLRMYINNIKVVEIATLTDTVTMNNSSLPMILGGTSNPATFKNIAYYNRALTLSELTQNYNVLGV